MVADQFMTYVQKWSIGRTVNLNDYSDKFHYLLMTIFLILFATLTTVRQYVFQPIVCEVASKPSGTNFAEYVSNLCWVEGTYSGIDPVSTKLSTDDSFWDKQPKAIYYQWVPFTLAVQAAMFFMPRLFWLAYVHNREGPDLEALLESGAEANKAVDWKLRHSLVDGISRNIDYMLRLRVGVGFGYDSRRKPWRRFFARRPRGCLPMLYVIVKLAFLANALGQMYAMGLQLAPDFHAPFLFGFHLIASLRNGSDWRATRLFPRVTLCRVKILHAGGPNTYTAQCVLPLNMLNEKIYCFLWIASAFGSCLTCLSLMQWAMRLICGHGRWRHHLRRYLLQQHGRSILPEYQLVYEFADHLHTDGVFLVHMLRLNVGEMIACDVTNALYRLWRERLSDATAGGGLGVAEGADAETRLSSEVSTGGSDRRYSTAAALPSPMNL